MVKSRRSIQGKWSVFSVLFGCLLAGPVSGIVEPARSYHFENQGSSIRIHVPRAGLLKVLGHDHSIGVQKFDGIVEWDVGQPVATRLELVVPVDKLEVLDEETSSGTREKIEAEMKGEKVLDSEAHPLIRFQSDTIKVTEPGTWRVDGQLSVRGVSQPVSFVARVDRPRDSEVFATGSLELKPADFGIAPVKALGGAVKTAEMISLTFDIRGVAAEGGRP